MTKKNVAILAPSDGKVIPLCATNDKVFASGTMGDGFGLQPIDVNKIQVVAPVSGKITMIASTKHAIGITTPNGLEVLIHMGIDTVKLNGDAFDIKCKVGENIKAGAPIAMMNLDIIKSHHLSDMILVIITNSTDKITALNISEKEVSAGGFVVDASIKDLKKKQKSKKNYDEMAKQIVQLVGGKQNISSVIHCITRLRFYLKDEKKAQTEKLKDVTGVIDVIKASGQYQVVIGNDVTNVFDAVMKQLGPLEAMDENQEVDTEKQNTNLVKRAFNELIGFITGSMSPVIGVIAASGIIKGILALLTLPQLGAILKPTSTIYLTISSIADSAFFFLPILVGYAAAKKLGSDPIVAAVIGGVLTYPQIIEWGKSFKTMFAIGNLNFEFLNYAYSIFPMIVAAWLAKIIGNWFKKHLPSYLQMIFNPLFTILIVSAITLVITGPVIQGAANGIANFINWLVQASGWLGGFVIGGLYQLLVIFGLHWGVVPLVAQQIAQTHQSALNAIISVTMVAQGAAVLAVAIKSKKSEMKELGFAAAISAFCGVTEPAIYGINLRFKKVFVSGLIGSAVGGLITGLMHGTMFGFTGSLIGFSSFFNPAHPTQLNSFYAFLISSIAAIIVSFLVTWFWGYKDNMKIGQKVKQKKAPGIE